MDKRNMLASRHLSELLTECATLDEAMDVIMLMKADLQFAVAQAWERKQSRDEKK